MNTLLGLIIPIDRCMARFWKDYYYKVVFEHIFEAIVFRLLIPTIKYLMITTEIFLLLKEMSIASGHFIVIQCLKCTFSTS